MSDFKCEQCGKEIIDSPIGYITWCEHYPKEQPREISDDKFLDWLDEFTTQQVKDREKHVRKIQGSKDITRR